jgi:hypothetical protein
MNRSLLVVILALFQLISVAACAQDYPMRHFTVEDGLPSNNVYFVYRDSRGFVWVGTDKGVARYNGIKFELFSTADGLPDNEVFFFQEDSYGRLWLGSFNGELCYYKDGIFHSAANTPFLRLPFVETHSKHISVEKDGTIIVSYGVRSKFLAINGERCKIFDLKKVEDASVANSVIFAKKLSDNSYKLICKDRIVYIDTLYRITGVESLDKKFISSGDFAASQNQEYLFNDNMLFTMDQKEVRKFPGKFTSSNFIHQAYVTSDGVFYATDRGLFFNDTLHILRENNLSCITQDDQKNYWISSLNDGIFVLKKDFRDSKFYKDVYKGVARYASVTRTGLVFATLGNNIFKLSDNKTTCLFTYKAKTSSLDMPVDFGFFIDDHKCYDIYHDDLTVIDNLSSPHVKTFRVPGVNGTKEILRSEGYFYLRQPATIVRLTIDNGRNSRPELDNMIHNNTAERIFGMARSPDGSIWYSTIHRMFRVRKNESDGIMLPRFKNTVLKYFDFFDGYLLGYTQDNKLLLVSRYDNTEPIVDSVMPQNCIWDKFYKIDSTTVLASTNNLYRLITVDTGGNSRHIMIHAVENPFIPLRAEAICTDGQFCYFLKNGSVTSVKCKSLTTNPDPPKIFFTSLKTSHGVFRLNGEIEVPYGESKNVTISFSTLSFGGKDVHYLYSVSKNDNDGWRDLKGEEINFVDPSYGVYTIKVKARTASSAYSTPVVLIVHILRPFWATPWFIIISFFCVAALAWLLIRLRVLYLVRRKEKEHTVEIKFLKSEYKALNALMNPHFIFNTLNNVQGLVNRNDKMAANEYIRVFSDLIRQNMHNISKDLIPLQKEIQLVTNYLVLEKLRFKEHLNYSINVEPGLDLSEIMVPPLLVQPLVENSIKHGILPLESQKGFININIYERDNELIVEVKDNGVGMSVAAGNKDSLHESFGLENMRKRIEQLGMIQNKNIRLLIQEITNSTGTPEGTSVQIIIPVHEEL